MTEPPALPEVRCGPTPPPVRFYVVLQALFLGSCFAAPRYSGPESDHWNGYRFTSPAPQKELSMSDVMYWSVTRDPPPWPEAIPQEPGPPPPDRVAGGDLRVTWVGHSTVLVQVAGLNILTDPVWSHRVGPVSWAGPTRNRPPALRFEDLPPIDAVLVSHNHYDHLDIPTVRRLADEHGPRVFVGLGVDLLLEEEAIPGAVAMDWGDSEELAPGVVVHAIPAQHFSGRGLTDFNRTLWLGFVIETPSGPIYYAGDTAFGPHYRGVRERFGPARLAVLPIGAYLPRWFMESNHMSPREAVYAHRILGAQTSVPCHFGTFAQADEAYGQPVKDLRAAFRWDEADHFWILEHGVGADVPPLPAGEVASQPGSGPT